MNEWKYEKCRLCKREQRIAWSVKDNVWNDVMGDLKITVCLECFLKMADTGNTEIKKEDFMFLGWIGENIEGDIVIDRSKN